MEYRPPGRTGVQVSELCFGTMPFGGDADEDAAARMCAACRDAGINFIDTAGALSGRDITAANKTVSGLLKLLYPDPHWCSDSENVRTVVRAHGLTLRQRGTSHAVITNARGRHLTIPMHKPIKSVYIRRLLELIETAQ